jgi:rhodanese-related sulfurtransferase
MTLINTLPAAQFEIHNIPGSINIPQNSTDFSQRVMAAVNGNKDAEIIVYCASQKCDSSTRGARKLEAAGFTNVFDYEGGVETWERELASA